MILMPASPASCASCAASSSRKVYTFPSASACRLSPATPPTRGWHRKRPRAVGEEQRVPQRVRAREERDGARRAERTKAREDVGELRAEGVRRQLEAERQRRVRRVCDGEDLQERLQGAEGVPRGRRPWDVRARGVQLDGDPRRGRGGVPEARPQVLDRCDHAVERCGIGRGDADNYRLRAGCVCGEEGLDPDKILREWVRRVAV